MRFIHTSDWQIGMPFNFLKEKSRDAMDTARLDSIKAIGRLAQDESKGIDFVLVCGDIVDSTRVALPIIKNMFSEISRIRKPVYLLAGNHEWNGTQYIFDDPYFSDLLPENVTVLHEGVNETCVPGVEILAAPLKGVHADRDVMRDVLSGLSPSNNIRIVAGHGALSSFIDIEQADIKLHFETIQTAIQSRLVDYVALGDRHSVTSIDSRGQHIDFNPNPNSNVLPIYYSGASEATHYRELDSGKALVVEIDAQKKVSVDKERVGKWNLLRLGSIQKPIVLRTQADVEELKRTVEVLDDPRETALKIYLDSELSLDDDEERNQLFKFWHEEMFAGFEVSDNDKVPGIRIKKDLASYEPPANLQGYVRETYSQLRAESITGNANSEVSRAAFGLLVSLLEGKR